jgi:hypothetical protein
VPQSVPDHNEALPDAPGLELVIVNLGLELAVLEQRHAQAQRADAAALVELLEDVSAQIAVAETLLSPVATWIAGNNPDRGPRPPGDDNVFTSIEAVRASREGRPLDRINSTTLYLVSLREVAVAESIVTCVSNTSTVAIARFAHTRSIRESSIPVSHIMPTTGLCGIRVALPSAGAHAWSA